MWQTALCPYLLSFQERLRRVILRNRTTPAPTSEKPMDTIAIELPVIIVVAEVKIVETCSSAEDTRLTGVSLSAISKGFICTSLTMCDLAEQTNASCNKTKADEYHCNIVTSYHSCCLSKDSSNLCKSTCDSFCHAYISFLQI